VRAGICIPSLHKCTIPIIADYTADAWKQEHHSSIHSNVPE